MAKKWRGVIVEFQMYTMSNFIVIKETNPMKRVTLRIRILTFSHRTWVDYVANSNFPLEPFRFRTIPQLINAKWFHDNELFDLIGEVVAKEDIKDLITTKGKGDKMFGGSIARSQVLKLTKNIRLSLGENNNIQELRNFAEWLLKIGDGLAGDTTNGESIVHIPSDILVKNSKTTLDDLIDFVYPDMLSNLSVENYFKDRVILASTLDCVTDINNKMTAGLPVQERVYLSSDSVCVKEGNMEFELDTFSPKILNRINCSGLPPHKLVVKIGALVMLLRNIDQTNGLCNGTRMQVRRMRNHVIECKTLTGNKAGSIVLIRKLNLIPNNETLPVMFQRRQFSIIMSFAMTINKSQEQTLSKVRIYLPWPVFTRGQLYVALSRVTSKDGLRVLLQDHGHLEDNCTMNVPLLPLVTGKPPLLLLPCPCFVRNKLLLFGVDVAAVAVPNPICHQPQLPLLELTGAAAMPFLLLFLTSVSCSRLETPLVAIPSSYTEVLSR
ncbi:uncharacterized protein LOC107614994 [Arachis ipaensis]|uniref:uncharacterized protein LOC107614994 n=1 Tax=Arachis ipaensis TaxID=130454 RepID=UPI000A2B2CBD|nr:uncharacterized protein LOC107614994 [Arachis ipaensis]